MVSDFRSSPDLSTMMALAALLPLALADVPLANFGAKGAAFEFKVAWERHCFQSPSRMR